MSLQQMLLFLAGAGIGPLLSSIKSMQPKQSKAGVNKEAAANPQQQMNPMLAQLIAMKMRGGGGMPPTSVPPIA
jgi:ferredoxin-NADP reductase